MTQIASRLYTVEEFIRMPEYHGRYELIDGHLVEKPVLTYEHSLIAEIIVKEFWKFDPEEKLGKMLWEVNSRLRPDYAPLPDISFWMADRKPARKMHIASLPDLAIEIQSPGQSLKSLTDKAEKYLQAGVKLVWIIQPKKQVVLVFRQGSSQPLTIPNSGELDGEDVIPGFRLPVSVLFDED